MLTLKWRFLVWTLFAVCFLLAATFAYASWSDPYQLTNNTTVNTNASLALDSNGKAHIVYQSGEGTATEIYYATNATTDTTWQTVRLTNNNRIDYAPDIAVYNNTPYIVYATDDPLSAGGDLEIVYRKKVGTGFTAADFSYKKLTSNGAYDSNPAIAVFNGRPFIAWEKVFLSEESDIELMFATYLNGSWVKRRLTNNGAKIQDEYPDIAVDKYGRARVVFQRTAGSYDSEIFQFFIKNPDTRYLKKLTDNSIDDVDPHITIDGGKSFIVYINANGAVWLRMHILGIGWLSPVRVVSRGANILPKIAARNGQAYVAYTTLDGDNSLGMRYVTSSNNWSTREIISNNASETVAEGFAIDTANRLHLVYENALFDKNNEVVSSSLNYIIK